MKGKATNVKRFIIKKLQKGRSFRRPKKSKNAEGKGSRDRHSGEMNPQISETLDRPLYESSTYESSEYSLSYEEMFNCQKLAFRFRDASSEPISVYGQDVEEEAGMDVHWPASPPHLKSIY